MFPPQYVLLIFPIPYSSPCYPCFRRDSLLQKVAFIKASYCFGKVSPMVQQPGLSECRRLQGSSIPHTAFLKAVPPGNIPTPPRPMLRSPVFPFWTIQPCSDLVRSVPTDSRLTPCSVHVDWSAARAHKYCVKVCDPSRPDNEEAYLRLHVFFITVFPPV